MSAKTKTKTAKLMTLWTQSPEEQEDKRLGLELKASELSAKADLLKAEEKLVKQGEVVNGLKQKLADALSKKGKDWSPAEIINIEIELEEAENLEQELFGNKTRIEQLIKEYL
jgi:hypothetical protein